VVTNFSGRNSNFVTLTGDPFVNAAGGNFALNNTVGAGADCRAAGIPGAFPGGTTTGYLDIGAVQHRDSRNITPSLASIILGFSGLAAYYKCDEASGNLTDSSGNSKTLTAANLTYSVTGQAGNAITFNGTSSIASRADCVLGATLPSAFSVGMLIKGSPQDNKFPVCVGKTTVALQFWGIASGNVGVAQSITDLKPRSINDASTSTIGADANVTNGTGLTGDWHVYVVSYSGGVYSVFLDGSPAGTLTVAQGTTTLDATALGCLIRSTNTNFFSGSLQHVWFRTAATTLSEARALWVASGLYTPNGSGLLHASAINGGI
jgi:hypothetical protein